MNKEQRAKLDWFASVVDASNDKALGPALRACLSRLDAAERVVDEFRKDLNVGDGNIGVDSANALVDYDKEFGHE